MYASTIRRAKEVMDDYKAVKAELGELANVVSRSYIYEKIRDHTHLSIRTIQRIINHSESYKGGAKMAF